MHKEIGMDIDFAFTQLVRPSGKVQARWIASIPNTNMVNIRYWQLDHKTARNKPVEITARYCTEHCICYLASDYPHGCPECEHTQVNQDALLSK